MPVSNETEYDHLGETSGCADHDHDLVHELSRRLDCLWRYDQYIANAEGQEELQEFWRGVKVQDQANIKTLKQLLAQHVRGDCF